MLATACPDRHELEHGLLGMLPESQVEQFEKHLEGCDRCLATLAQLEARDTLVEALRAARAATADMAAFGDQVRTLVESWASGDASHGDTNPSVSSAFEATSELGTRPEPPNPVEDEETAFLAPPQAADELGRLGSYRVLRVLGAGGMGVVFEAEDIQLRRRVALKAMKPSVAASASARKRFVREAQTAASVEHDHVVPIYQVAEERGIPFIAMPLLRGETLAERLAREPLSTTEIVRIGREIALGLEAAHRVGLVHRDIKPGNIWLETGSGRVKILDFGLARVAGGDDHLTHAGTVLGTPSYMAPEQGRGETIDARADLFSLGCVLYHCATGSRPFIGRDPLSTLLAVTMHNPPPPRELKPDLPEALSQLIVSLLSKDPAGRPQSSHDIVERLAVHLPLPTGEGRGEGGLRLVEDGLPSPSSDDLDALKKPTAENSDEIANCELQIANCKLEEAGETNPKPKIANRKSPPPPPRLRWPLTIAAAAAAALVFGIVIIIKNEKGKEIARFEAEQPFVVGNLAPGYTASVEEKTEGSRQKAETTNPKTQDLSPKTSSSNPKSKIHNPKSLPPVSQLALVTEPFAIDGVKSWTLETIDHRGGICGAEYSPDGNWLATLGDDGSLRLWDSATGKLARIIVCRHQGYGVLAWSADSAQLAVVDTDAIFIWVIATGKLAKIIALEPAKAIYAVAWSPDGKTMALGLARSANDRFQHLLELVEVESGELLESRGALWREPNDRRRQPQNLCWSPDSERLAFNTTIWQVASGRTQAAAGKLGTSFAWRADGALLTAVLTTVDDVCKVELWRADTGELLSILPGFAYRDGGGGLPPVQFSPRGDVLLEVAITSLDKPSEAFIWNTTSYETIKTIALSPYLDTGDFRVSPDGDSMASFGWYAGTLRIVKTTGMEQTIFHRPALLSSRTSFVAAWSPSNDMLAARSEDERIGVWDLASGRRRALTAYSACSDSLAWQADEPLLEAWLNLGGALGKNVIDGDAGHVRRSDDIVDELLAGAQFRSSQGSAFAVAHSDRVKIFSGDPPRLLRELETASKFAPAFSRDGRRLATIADKTTIWDVLEGKPLASLDVAAPVEWSPDGQRLAYVFANGERFEVRNAESGELLAELRARDPETTATRGPTIAAGARLAWSPDGSRLAGFGRVWNASSGEVVCDLQRFGCQANTGQPAWSPDGGYVAYCAPDRALSVADATTGRELANLFSLTRGRALLVGANGHYHASPRFEVELVYVVETDAGQETLSPQEFADKYGWRNDPSLARIGLASHSPLPLGEGRGEGVLNQKAAADDDGQPQTSETSPHPSPLSEKGGTNQPKSKIQNPKSLSPLALVQQPAALPGVESWSLESRTPQLSAVEWYSPRIALHPEGSSLAVGGPDGIIRVYDMFGGKSPRLTRLLLGHASPIETLDWSPDGQWLASAEAARPSVRVWNLATGGCQAEGAAALNCIRWLRWSPDGRTIAVAGLGGACLLDALTAEVIVPLDTHPDAFGLSWSPDASRVAVSGLSCLQICDAASGERLHFITEPGGAGRTQASVAWSPDGQSIAYASLRGVWIWEPSSGALKKKFIVPDLLGLNFPPIAWVDMASRLSIGTAHGTEIWDVVTGTKTAGDPQLAFRGVRSANRRAIANLDYSTAEVTVYDSVSKKRRSVPMRSYLTAAAWSPDGRALAAAAASPHLRIHLWTNGEAPKLETLASPGIGNETVLLNWLDGGSLFDAHAGTGVAVFSRGKEGWQSRLLGIGVTAWPNQALAVVSAGGTRLAYVAQPGDGKTVHILDVANGKSLRDVMEPDVQPAALALSPGGERLACFNTNGGLVIWETATGNRQRQAPLWPRDRFTNEALISWSPDGKQIALSTQDGVVRLMDDQLNVRRELAGHDHGQGSFGAKTLQWSGDGQTLQTADARKIRLWNAETGELLRATSHGLPRQLFEYSHFNQWQFSPDQSRLVTTGSAARVWDAATGRLQATLVDLRNGEGAVVSPGGHYFGTPKAESDLVYVVQTADGQELLSPKEFAEKYGWKNDRARVSPPIAAKE